MAQLVRHQGRLGWAILVAAALITGYIAMRGEIFSRVSQSLSVISSILPLRTATVTLYFTDAEGRYLVPVSRFIKASSNIERVALEELIRGPERGSVLAPSVPREQTLRSVAVRSGIAYVELGGYQVGDMAKKAMIHTLTDLPGIRQVMLSWDDKETEGALSRPRCINAEKHQASTGSDNTRPVILYFLSQGNLVPVTRKVGVTEDLPLAALQEFLNGPLPDGGLTGPPSGIQLLNLHVANGVAHVRLRFDEQLQSLMERGVWNFYPYHSAVIYTLTEFPQIRRVQFDFVGLTPEAVAGCQTPSIPLARPMLRERKKVWLNDC
ncbi:MAG: GerMN domain-containing protein [Acidobacteria bacterium]|nr:GerMN domain-containing protein [Acidobacteriota bacterium]